jgi:osmoprotectant transport system permease protein
VLLTVIALVVGFALSMLLAWLAWARPRSYGPITWTAGILYTIPSIALFALLVPFTGLSLLTAEIGLVSYTLLILIRNIVTGLQGTPPSVVEAGLGMGFSDREVLWRLRLPLAVPVVISGLRVAAVTTIGLVTVTALIGRGGLGVFILRGLQRAFTTEILVGTVVTVALALLVDSAFVLAERRLAPWVDRATVR